MATAKEEGAKPASNFTVHGTAGKTARHALDAQLVFANRLLAALVKSGALTAEVAKGVLAETADGVEKKLPKPPNDEAGKSLYYTLIVERFHEFAKGLRGLAKALR